MNENLNLVEILRGYPRGTKLYSIMHGEVEFEKISYTSDYPIIFKYKGEDGNYYMDSTTVDGKFKISSGGECTLFPSKDQRDWSKFNAEHEMIDGEFYYCYYDHNKKENSFIFIYEKHKLYKTKCYATLSSVSSILFIDAIIIDNKNITELRKATVEEKQYLLEAVKRKGYKWDEERKKLVKIEPKFDISTLQHFNRVLVRGTNGEPWSIDFFSHIIKNDDIKSPIFCCMCSVPQQCIPYNEETKHLVGKIKMPYKKYITWEE